MNKIKNIFEILEIRKTYQKPLIINFKNIDSCINLFNTDPKVKTTYVRAKILNYSSIKNSFPIKFQSKSNEQHTNCNSDLNVSQIIKENMKTIIELIHGNYSAKDDIVQIIHKEYFFYVLNRIPQLSKGKIIEFFQKYVEKIRNEDIGKVNIFLICRKDGL